MNDYIPQNGEWNEAYYMLSTMSLEGNVNGIRRMDPLSNHRRLLVLDTEDGFRTSRVIWTM